MDKNDDILMDGIDERIEAFLRGEMSAEEEADFKQEIRQNPELRNRAMVMTSLIKGIRRKEGEREKEAIYSTNKDYKSKIRPVIKWICSAAAIFAIIFVFSGRVSMSPPKDRYEPLDEIVSSYYNQYDMTSILRGDVDSVAVVHLYTLFSQIPKSRNMSSIIKELEPIYHSLDEDFTYHPWANDISWNLALAYVKNDQIDKAISILNKLKADNPDTPIYNRADELIKKLQDL